MSVFQVDDDGELIRDRQGFVRIGGVESIAQDVTVILRLFRGEIPTRTDIGTRWFTLLDAGLTEAALSQAVTEEGVLSRPGVVAVDDVVVDLGGSSRQATVSYRATVDIDDLNRRLLDAQDVTVTL